VLNKSAYFDNGEIITLYRNDKTYCPWFRKEDGSNYWAISLVDIVEIDSDGNTIRTYACGDSLDGGTVLANKGVCRMKSYKIDLSGYTGRVRELVSEAVQKKAFELGYKWSTGLKTPEYLGAPCLYVEKNGDLLRDDTTEHFQEYSNTLISVDDFLALTTAEDAPEFKPFDKVLARDELAESWSADIFSHMNGGLYVCVGDGWFMCIPYEGNEHRVGTTE
jgi:hypothetical protein